MYFFTADEHYHHANIIKYTCRPFQDVDEMNAELIRRHNAIVTPQDVTVHVGDFCLGNKTKVDAILAQLNGQHVLLRGSHDSWMNASFHEVWEKTIDGQYVVACHYPMRAWPKSHHGSWQLFGHCHGEMMPIGKQMDVGVDSAAFAPISFDEIKAFMAKQPETPRHHLDGRDS